MKTAPEDICARCHHGRESHLDQPFKKGEPPSSDRGWCTLPEGHCIFGSAPMCACPQFVEPEEIPVKIIKERHELVALAKELGVREDWHEPDEQEVTAEVKGRIFDNAGHWPEPLKMPDWDKGPPIQEKHVVIKKDGASVAAVNLATLFSWACGHDQ